PTRERASSSTRHTAMKRECLVTIQSSKKLYIEQEGRAYRRLPPEKPRARVRCCGNLAHPNSSRNKGRAPSYIKYNQRGFIVHFFFKSRLKLAAIAKTVAAPLDHC